MARTELERLAARVKAAAREDGLIETAQVKLLGLDDVRVAAGARWPRLREYVREGSLRIIAERIGPDDAAIPCGDGFLVVFAEASAEQSQSRCAEIRRALLGYYLGEEALEKLSASVACERVSAGQLSDLVAEDVANAAPARRGMITPGRFWPVWSAQRMAIAAYLCAPAIETKEGLRLGYAAEFAEKAAHVERDYLDLDLCLLEQACTAAETGAAPIGLTVHATTLQSRKLRMTYLEHLAANISTACQRMFVTIAEIEPGTPLLSLSEWTVALKHHVARVALDLHHSDRAIAALGSTGAWAAGCQLPPQRVKSSAQARLALAELDRWCRSLRRQGLMPFINGFEDATMLDFASYSDLAFASGEKLWPSQDQPRGLMAATRTRRRAPSSEAAMA